MFYTTVEQSQALLKVGVKPETADMVYASYTDVTDGTKKYRKWAMEITPMMGEIKKDELPAWSSDALMKLLPKHIEKYGVVYDLEIKYMEDFAYIMYVDGQHKTVRFNNTGCVNHVSPDCEDYADGIYQMIFWLINDGYLSFVNQTEMKNENNTI